MNKAGDASYDDFLLELDAGGTASKGRTLPVLHEILRIIEKKAARLSDPLLSFHEYMALGKKRAPNFLYDRREIYSMAAPNVARVYERMKDSGKAIKAWSDLGRPREVNRVRRKLARMKEKASQPRLL